MKTHPAPGLCLLHPGFTECQGQEAPHSLALQYCGFLISFRLTRAVLDDVSQGLILLPHEVDM